MPSVNPLDLSLRERFQKVLRGVKKQRPLSSELGLSEGIKLRAEPGAPLPGGQQCEGSARSGVIGTSIEIVLRGTGFAGRRGLKKAEAQTLSGAVCGLFRAATATLLRGGRSEPVNHHPRVLERLFLGTQTSAGLPRLRPPTLFDSIKPLLL